MKKFIFGGVGLLLINLNFQVTSTASANPYKVVWQRCAEGSEVEYVIRCRLEGGEECFANCQGHCDEPPSMGG